MARVEAKPQEWPGTSRLQLGAAVGFNSFFGYGYSGPAFGYEILTDISFRLAQTRVGSVWMGAGFNFTPYDIREKPIHYEPWIFVTTTFEKRVRIPLVPFFRIGIGGDVIDYHGVDLGREGAFVFRLGAGFDYWVVKWLGLGIQMNFSIGARDASGFISFYGSGDIDGGARFAF